MAKVKRPGALSRRAFILTAGAAAGGLAISLRLLNSVPHLSITQSKGTEILNWIVVAPDNTVTMRIAQVEMGQGTITAMAQLLAEELEVDWSKIRTEFISIMTHLDRNKVYGRTDTWGSLGVKLSESLLRTAGAQIRTMFIAAAAHRLGVPESELTAERSIVTHKSTGRTLTFGELAFEAAMVAVPDPNTIKLKDPKEWKYIGKSLQRLDIPMKSDGTAVFGIDVMLPGMKHAAIMMSPVFGGRLKSYDARTALSSPGVIKVVEIKGGNAGFVNGMDDAIAVVADHWWQAKTAVDAMPKEWDGGKWATVDSAAILDNLRNGLVSMPEQVLRNDGDVETALSSAAHTLEAEYFVPYLEHATMEPMNCTALVTNDAFTVWAPTQRPERALEVAANVVGLPMEKGELHITLLGGGFGRRQQSDFVSQAVQIAKEVKGTPIKLLWSREDTIRNGFYRATSLSRVRGALDAGGNLVAWAHRVVSHSNNAVHSTYGADSLLYAVPNMKVDRVVRQSHVPEIPLRGIAFAMNCFVTQSFVDELARAAGKDTYQFQRALLDPAKTPPTVPKGQLRDDITPSERAIRLRAVLDEAASKADWGRTLGQNRGRGIATDEEASAFYAVVVEVTLDGRWFSVDRVVVAGDPGFLVNPENAKAQVEGSVAFGLTSAMYSEITISDGSVAESNFHDYQLLRMNEMPKVEVHWVLSRQFWGGVGEPVVSAVMPALTNAIYDAGGPRIRSLPLKNHNIIRRVQDAPIQRGMR